MNATKADLAAAAAICLWLRNRLRRRVLRATKEQHESGAHGNWLNGAETLRRAALALKVEEENLQ